MSWTDERVETLKKLWNDGFSASQIAAEIGGVTRNAVIGKVHRLGLSGRGKPTVQLAPRTIKRNTAPRSGGGFSSRSGGAGALALKGYASPVEHIMPEAKPLLEVVIASERVTIMDLREGMCRWPLGDPLSSEFRYCGSDCSSGLPYCAGHANVAYHGSSDKKRERREKAASAASEALRAHNGF